MKSLLLLLVLAGCVGTRYDLGSEWDPLRRIEQAPWVADGMVTTVAGVAYTRNLAVLLDSCPPGSPELTALLTHERVHARHERDLGVQFYVDYAAFPSKRWEEESQAWDAELAYKRAHHMEVDVEWYAHLASENYGGMIGYDQALVWFQERAK